MKRLCLVCSALVFVNLLAGQYPSFEQYSTSGISAIFFKGKRTGAKSKFKTEIPPWIIGGGEKSYFFVDGSDTYIWTSPIPLTVKGTINFKKEADGPFHASCPYINSPEYDSLSPTNHWKRTYHAIYSAAYFQHPSEGPVNIGFLHGENKNLVLGDANSTRAKRFPNTIQPNVPIDASDPNSYSGGSPFHEGWKAYNALISASWTPNNASTNWGQQFFDHEMGPIVWPATGYVTREGVKGTSGLKHPSSIVFDNYIYVFYAEGGRYSPATPEEEGRMEGIKVARAALKDALNPMSYEVYYKAPNGQETWHRSLPEGFTKENMLQFVSVKGARSTDIMTDTKQKCQEIRFSVAKVSNSNYFIGVEEYIDQADRHAFKVALRFSKDLVHWTDRVYNVCEAADWDHSQMNYPVLMSKDGWSNNEIDIEDFYILGTEPGVKNYVNRIHFQAPGGNSPTAFAFNGRTRMQVPPYMILPNPNSGRFKLSYILDTLSHVAIDLFDLSGQQIQSLDQQKQPGKYVQDFDISAYPMGVYLVAVRVEEKRYVYRVLKTN